MMDYSRYVPGINDSGMVTTSRSLGFRSATQDIAYIESGSLKTSHVCGTLTTMGVVTIEDRFKKPTTLVYTCAVAGRVPTLAQLLGRGKVIREDNMMANLLMFLTAAFLISSGSVHSAAAKNRRGRQGNGELTEPIDCSFPLNIGRNSTTSHNSPIERVSFCHFTTNGPFVDGTLPWLKGLASLGNWLGGPETGASNSSDENCKYGENGDVTRVTCVPNPPKNHNPPSLNSVDPVAEEMRMMREKKIFWRLFAVESTTQCPLANGKQKVLHHE
ncbi:hypothetical protein DAPPUDRAFT_240590 [Daphnia pulex]|uniref:Uncharacterized protein n=1 Tax=Daphnia pulex TaxID=6669 RepID=E9GBW9_DAPPU|nr:hypothetical protein DAPPUDRAFT_240590 [Daphnia pulex]|eukprot:EFX83081.1 hypothetical protein DAPPUDRAFT_240590 [Daphnia pulex]